MIGRGGPLNRQVMEYESDRTNTECRAPNSSYCGAGWMWVASKGRLLREGTWSLVLRDR